MRLISFLIAMMIFLGMVLGSIELLRGFFRALDIDGGVNFDVDELDNIEEFDDIE